MGSEEKQFFVHKDVLCSTSEFFKCALKGDWKEATGHPFTIPEANEDAFAAYVDWLYTEGLKDLYIDPSCESSDHTTCKKCFLDWYFPPYLLGDYLQDKHFCNTVIDQFLAKIVQLEIQPSMRIIEKCWNMIPKSSGFRRLLVDLEALNCSTSYYNENAEKWRHDYLVEVARVWHKLYRNGIDEADPKHRGRCYYHDGDDKPNHCKYSKTRGGRSRKEEI